MTTDTTSAATATASPMNPPSTTLAAALIDRRSGLTAGIRGSWLPTSSAGRSPVIAASSANVRDASVRPTRPTNSSWVSRPCTNAACSTPTTCSRSARDVRSSP